jgi:hypothetical protein
MPNAKLYVFQTVHETLDSHVLNPRFLQRYYRLNCMFYQCEFSLQNDDQY